MARHGSGSASISSRTIAFEALLDQGLGERLLGGEVPVDGSDADARPAGDVLDLRLSAVLGEGRAGGIEHLRAVADGVGSETLGDDRGRCG